jgi:hypothetical protein
MTYFDPDQHPEMAAHRPRRDEADEDFVVPDIAKKDWAEGDRVLAPWGRASLFPGTVAKVAPAEIYVHFDDGDRGWAAKDQVHPLQIITAGSRIFCRWKGGRNFYPGTIVQMSGERIFVRYDDGDSEWSVLGLVAVPTGLRPTVWEHFAMNWTGYIWLLAIIGFWVLRSCR